MNESDGYRVSGGGNYLLSFVELLIQVGDLLSKTGEFWCG